MQNPEVQVWAHPDAGYECTVTVAWQVVAGGDDPPGHVDVDVA